MPGPTMLATPPVPLVPPMRTLVVDDDALARDRLRALLAHEGDVQVVDECGDGEQAARRIASLRPDLVLLDVQMPRLDGFGVVERVGSAAMPPVIFVSAFGHFAVRAFEAFALDYVLKPYEPLRLAAALARARAAVLARRGGPMLGSDARLAALLAQVQRPEVQYPESLAVKLGDQYHVVRVSDIDWIEADGNHARLHLQQRPRLIAKSLATLERQLLDPARFVRVHRGAIVNVEKIVAVEPLFHGDAALVLRDGTRVDCSRRFRDRLQGRLYFTT
ncbi:MAG: LytTR family DNA-binding domain-containing protein [Gemmatimonadaceae bacterium]|jgi:two-component system LytT family response regulator|nr:LytTR family DNA-binding domain-containing protein [Gemmatimonadaceae bacterium]